ncbi:MAG TPA: ABC transporter ATP-binding protein [Steroidobacteraceae bacterium]|nr:ABC transporter ATP-binding protein [Steroidobacteraceae bacterium]
MIELQSIGRHFRVGEQVVHALDHVSLAFSAGEYVSIMGPSGSGKSTLLNVLGLLDRPTAGRYVLDGRDTTGLPDDELAALRSRKNGFVFQSFHLVPRMTARENIELPMVLAAWPPTERRARVDRVLADLGLADRAHHRPDQLSGGQRQRVAIARAMIMEPTVLLADEPTGNLDHVSGADVLSALEGLNSRGILLIVVTHDNEVAARARRHVKMRDGRVVLDEGGESAGAPP